MEKRLLPAATYLEACGDDAEPEGYVEHLVDKVNASDTLLRPCVRLNGVGDLEQLGQRALALPVPDGDSPRPWADEACVSQIKFVNAGGAHLTAAFAQFHTAGIHTVSCRTYITILQCGQMKGKKDVLEFIPVFTSACMHHLAT